MKSWLRTQFDTKNRANKRDMQIIHSSSIDSMPTPVFTVNSMLSEQYGGHKLDNSGEHGMRIQMAHPQKPFLPPKSAARKKSSAVKNS